MPSQRVDCPKMVRVWPVRAVDSDFGLLHSWAPTGPLVHSRSQLAIFLYSYTNWNFRHDFGTCSILKSNSFLVRSSFSKFVNFEQKKLLAPASRNYSCLKMLMTMLLACTGLIPLIHWVAKQGLHSQEVETFLPHILKFYTYMILGFIVHIARLVSIFILSKKKLNLFLIKQ